MRDGRGCVAGGQADHRPSVAAVWMTVQYRLLLLYRLYRRPAPLRRGAAASQPAVHPERREVELVQYTTVVGGTRETLLLDQVGV